MSDFHTEGLLDRDATPRPICSNCGGERVELEDGHCWSCLRFKPHPVEIHSTDVWERLFRRRGDA